MTRHSLFSDWLAAHHGIVVKVARSFAQSPAEIADLRQELLLQLWLSMPAYAGDAKASTFVYRVCLNTALSWRRSAKRREGRIAEADLASLEADAATPLDAVGDRELVEKLYESIHELPEADRALVLLSLDGVSYREMAEITGLSENHVGVALTRARKKLSLSLKGVVDEVA